MDKNSRSSFYGLGIAPGILETIDAFGFTVPTPIQQKAIPIALEGKDVIGIAQTGTGKTVAFGIPMIQRLAARKGRGLILVPTRELALQVSETIARIAAPFGLRCVVIIGGESMNRQIGELKRDPRIVIATPGRLLDHLRERRIRLDDVHVLVLDEADRMLDMGFAPQIEQILRTVPKDRQTLLFSATLPSRIVGIASSHMKLPVRTEIAPAGTTVEKISQEIFVVQKEDKGKLLTRLLDRYPGPVLLFTRTKRGARRVTQSLKNGGFRAAEIHADRSLNQRKEALEGFKSGKYRILAATDIAARGIDVTGIELVINYDLPDDPENYVHRIGRTGRAGREGHAVSFATPDQKSDVETIEKLIRKTIPLSAHPDLPKASFGHPVSSPARPPQQHARRQGRHHQGRPSGGARHGQARSPRSSDKLFDSIYRFMKMKKG